MHICKLCDYSTKDRRNYTKHLKTKKHLKNSKLPIRGANSAQMGVKLSNDRKYTCNKCHKSFKRKYHLKRHMESFCKGIKKDIRKINNEFKLTDSDEISDVVETYEERLLKIEQELGKNGQKIQAEKLKKSDIKDKPYGCRFCSKRFNRKYNRKRHMDKCKYVRNYIDSVEKERDMLRTAVDKTTNMSKMREIATKYPDAEPLKLLNYSDYLDNTNYKLDKSRPHQDFEEQFLEEIISAHKSKSSHITVGEAIINVYKTEEAKDRSLWCTDVSRLKYMVMKLNLNNKPEWMSDPNGEYTQSQIINPIMDKIRDLLKKYIDGHYIKKHKKHGKVISKEYIDKYFKYIVYANDLFDKIERKKFQPKLLRYLSKHFSTIKGIIKDQNKKD